MSERIVARHLRDRREGRTTQRALSIHDAFLQPSAHHDDGEPWNPPSPSTASRLPPARSRHHSRGFVIDHATNRAVVFESMLERDLACILLADRRVVSVQDQPPAVTYVDASGRPRRHTFDYLARMRSGERVAFAVKPSARVRKSGIEETLDAIRAQVTGFADRILLRTERQITRYRGSNARDILRARLGRNDGDVVRAASLISTLDGTARFGDLVALCGDDARARNAVLCLIDDGILEPAKHARLGDGCLVHLAVPSRKEA